MAQADSHTDAPFRGRTTIRDIADLAGVSIATVSRVLNDRPDVAPETRENVLQVVREHGFRVLAAEDGYEAIRALVDHQVDLLFTDIAMPGMTGHDLQRELKLRRQEIPIVFITAHRDETVRPRVLEQGAVECLFKPFSERALVEALNAALRVS